MKIIFVLCLPIIVLAQSDPEEQLYPFPSDFKFGVSTSSYQIEGAWNTSGKGENIWDTFTHEHSSKIKNKQNADKSCDSYHVWRKDVELLHYLGVNFYRFSISWSRLLPTGYSNQVNNGAVKYYNNLIDELITYGIHPVVTLYHGDLPQSLQNIGGWANSLVVTHYENYANLAFRLFGDRVKAWITFNDPYQICVSGYGTGDFAPGIKSSGISDYICGKNILMAHANAFNSYKRYYKKKQKGKIGISLKASWYQSKTGEKEDLLAAERALEMTFGWFANPIFSKNGDYPSAMKCRVSFMSNVQKFSITRLTQLCKDDIKLIRGSADFLGLNYYTSHLVSNNTNSKNFDVSFENDLNILKEDDPEWKSSALPDLKDAPEGLKSILLWIKHKYKNPDIYITENGFADTGELNDTDRINYLQGHLGELQKAITVERCKVKGYSVWSLLDNFAWKHGYTIKFGLYSVNFTDPLRGRQPKASAQFYKSVVSEKAVRFQD